MKGMVRSTMKLEEKKNKTKTIKKRYYKEE